MLLLVAGAVVAFLVLGGGGTPVNVSEALQRFRADQKSGRPVGGLLPEAGVYTYATTGSESLDIPGFSRTFPDRTSVIVSSKSCGVDMSWVPLAEHVESLVVCPGESASVAVQSSTVYEEFAGISTTDTVECPPSTYMRPPELSSRESWSTTCTTQGGKVRAVGQVLGLGTVKVGSRSVPSVHTRLTYYYSGTQTGVSPADYWLSLDGSLLLREVETADVSQGSSPVGSVRYRESLTLSLLSTTPLR